MEPVLIFRHVAIEGPGYFAEFLSRHGTPYRVIAVDEGEGAPTDLQGISALVFMGGPMSANDPLPWVEAELRLIRQAAIELVKAGETTIEEANRVTTLA